MARRVLALAGRCLVAAIFVESWLPWRTTFSGNLTETNPSYSGVPPSSGSPEVTTASRTTSVWWSEWNFKVLFQWTNYAVFSTPDRKGSLRTDGGWAPYFVDKLGVLCFGQYWLDRPSRIADPSGDSPCLVLSHLREMPLLRRRLLSSRSAPSRCGSGFRTPAFT